MYIHPSFAADKEHYKGNYNDSIALALGAFGWGWHSETALNILKMFAGGFFDRFPKVKIIIGHMGEILSQRTRQDSHLLGRFRIVVLLRRRTWRKLHSGTLRTYLLSRLRFYKFLGLCFLTAFNAGMCGSKNAWTLIILRFFAKPFGLSPKCFLLSREAWP